ncbi:MAG TPA: nucleotidyltransferase family protein, partial [Nitrospiria bacterium]|nr:nucleotidyltransferase family protein [Nitrospiria bacterium]
MKAMVLAAGLGTRMAPLTQKTPKPLIPLNGKPFLFYTLKYLAHYGIREIVINLHHLGDQMRAFLGDGASHGVKIVYSEEPEILGTGGGIKKAEKLLGKEPFLVINSDLLTDIRLDHFIRFHFEKRGLASLVLREDPLVDRYGAIEINGSSRIRRILGKGAEDSGPLQKRMFAGIHILDPAVLEVVPPGIFCSITDTYIDLLSQGAALYGFETADYWADIGNLDQYRQINASMADNKI